MAIDTSSDAVEQAVAKLPPPAQVYESEWGYEFVRPLLRALAAERDALQAALLLCARQADALKLPCGYDPESPQAIRNGQYAAISHTAHVALGTLKGPSAIATLQADNAKLRAGEAMIKALLNSYGVSDERMRGRVSNGIEVLMTRMTRMEVALRERADSATAEVTKLRAEVEGLRRGEKDTHRLDALAGEYWDLRSFEIPTGAGDADVGWRVVSFHQSKPHERIVAKVYHDDPRAAIDAALTSTGGDAK